MTLLARQVYIVHPEGMEFEDWANALIMAMNGVVTSLSTPSADSWQEWASALTAESHILPFQPPNPYEFDDWREWAQMLIQTLGPAGM